LPNQGKPKPYLIGETKMSDGGKGSKPRPYSVSDQEYATRWDAIFNRDSETDKPTRNNQETQDTQNFKVDNSGKSLL
jgi:hypothetical protein